MHALTVLASGQTLPGALLASRRISSHTVISIAKNVSRRISSHTVKYSELFVDSRRILRVWEQKRVEFQTARLRSEGKTEPLGKPKTSVKKLGHPEGTNTPGATQSMLKLIIWKKEKK